jgi:hypothetical protein
MISPKLLKIAAISYAVKTLLVGLAWLAVPDLPQKAMAKARMTWSRVTGHEAPAPSPAPSRR